MDRLGRAERGLDRRGSLDVSQVEPVGSAQCRCTRRRFASGVNQHARSWWSPALTLAEPCPISHQAIQRRWAGP